MMKITMFCVRLGIVFLCSDLAAMTTDGNVEAKTPARVPASRASVVTVATLPGVGVTGPEIFDDFGMCLADVNVSERVAIQHVRMNSDDKEGNKGVEEDLKNIIKLQRANVTIPKTHEMTGAIESAKKYMVENWASHRDMAINIFTALLALDTDQKETICKAAIDAACTATKNISPDIRKDGIKFFKILWGQNLGYTQALKTAEELIDAKNSYLALPLLEAFITTCPNVLDYEKQISDQATKIAAQEVKDISFSTLDFFNLLISKNLAFAAAAQAASKVFLNAGYDQELLQKQASDLLQKLLELNQGTTKIIDAACNGVNNLWKYGQKNALKLFKILFTKNLGRERAIATVREGLQSKNPDFRSGACDLFEELFTHNARDILDLAFDVVDAYISALKYTEARTLLLKLINLNIPDSKEKIIALIQKAIYKPINSSSLDFLLTLINKEFAYDIVADYAMTGIKSSDETIRKKSLDIFKALFVKNQGLEEAIDVRIEDKAPNTETTQLRFALTKQFSKLINQQSDDVKDTNLQEFNRIQNSPEKLKDFAVKIGLLTETKEAKRKAAEDAQAVLAAAEAARKQKAKDDEDARLKTERREREAAAERALKPSAPAPIETIALAGTGSATDPLLKALRLLNTKLQELSRTLQPKARQLPE